MFVMFFQQACFGKLDARALLFDGRGIAGSNATLGECKGLFRKFSCLTGQGEFVLIPEDMDELSGDRSQNLDAGELGFGLLEAALSSGDGGPSAAFATEFEELAELERGLRAAAAAVIAAAEHVLYLNENLRIRARRGLDASSFRGLYLKPVCAERRIVVQGKASGSMQRQPCGRSIGFAGDGKCGGNAGAEDK